MVAMIVSVLVGLAIRRFLSQLSGSDDVTMLRAMVGMVSNFSSSTVNKVLIAL